MHNELLNSLEKKEMINILVLMFVKRGAFIILYSTSKFSKFIINVERVSQNIF